MDSVTDWTQEIYFGYRSWKSDQYTSGMNVLKEMLVWAALEWQILTC